MTLVSLFAFIKFLLLCFPESVALTTLSTSILGLKIPFRIILISGLIDGFQTYIVKQTVPTGYHTLVAFVFYVIIIHLITKISLKTSIIVGVISFAALLGIETIYYNNLLPYLGFPVDEVFNSNDIVSQLKMYLPEIGILSILAILVRNFKINLTGYVYNAR